jgi:hypothetical protein
MLGAALFFAAAAAAWPVPAGPADIEINARVRARELRIEQQGEARLRVRAEPPAGDKVEVERNLPKGQRRYRNLDIKLDAEARIAGPAARSGETQSQTGE